MRFSAIRPMTCLSLFFAVAIAGSSVVRAQSTTAPATAPTTAPAADAVPQPTTAKVPEFPTLESIQARIKLIQEQTSLDESMKSKIVEVYNQAITDLGRIEESNARIAEFQKQRQEAPGSVEEMSRLAEEPIPEPDIKPPPDAKLSELEKSLAEAEATAKTWQSRLASLETEIKGRDERVKTLTDQIARQRKEFDDVNNALANPAIADDPPELAAAHRAAQTVKAAAIGRELDALKMDLERTDFLTALRDYTTRETTRLEKVAKAWQNIVNDRRRAEVEAAAEKAREAEKEAESQHPVIAQLARENSELAESRKKIAEKLEKLAQTRKGAEDELAKIKGRMSSTLQTVEGRGLSQQMAMVLRRYRDQLPSVRELRRQLSAAQREMKDLGEQLISLDEKREAARDQKAELRERMLRVESDLPKSRRDSIKTAVDGLLGERKKYINDLWSDYNNYFEKLGGTEGLVDVQQELLVTTESFGEFINEHVFWARSTTPPEWSDLNHLRDAFGWLTNPKHWIKTSDALLEMFAVHNIEAGLTGLLLIGLLVVRPRVRSALRAKGEAVSKSYAPAYAPTVEAFLLTLFAAIPLPLALWTLGWFLHQPYELNDLGRALARALQFVAPAVFAIDALRQTCRAKGLAEAHYNWPTKVVRLIARSCWLLLVIGVPVAMVTIMIDWKSNNHWERSLGRLLFCSGEILMGVVLWGVLGPRSSVLGEIPIISKGGWQARVVRGLFLIFVSVPVVLVVLSIIGFHFTAFEVAMRFNRTLWLIIGLVILHGLGLRWLLISRRKLAIEQARQRRAALEAKQMAEAAEASPDSPPVVNPEIRATEPPPEPEMDISSLNEQTRAILRAISVLVLIFIVWTVWVDVIPALKVFDRVQLWSARMSFSETVVGKNGQPEVQSGERMVWITLTDLFVSILYVLAAIIAIKNLPGLLEIGIYRRFSLGAGERYAITTVLKYVFTIVGIIFAFGAIGIGWSQVQWLAAAITVGLGFGLQEIFANFVSGLIILFERPVRVGDIVSVAGVDGRVTRIQMRATTIMNWDHKELIIPNKEFVTGQVINWTLSDEILRILINVGVAYGTDTRKVRDLIMKVVTEHRDVLKDPAPQVVFTGFGASSLDFQARLFVKSPSLTVSTGDELNHQLDAAFREAGIEIAFPQMEVRVRELPKELVRGREEC